MMAGNPNWWSMNGGMHPQISSQFVYGSSDASSIPVSAASANDQDFPVRSWSHLLLGGGEEQEKYGGISLFQQQKKMENWEDEVLNLNPSFPPRINDDPVKQEVPQSHLYDEELIHPNKPWPRQHHHHHHHHHHQGGMPASSPTSCITSLTNTLLNFSGGKTPSDQGKNHQHNQDHSSECNSTNSGGVSKKARVQQSSAQPVLKVRKEKLGDRITALHQLVSPFGKTDTASVLSEAIGYIRFYHGQIEALSSPYMRNSGGSVGTGHHPQHSDSQSRNDLRSRGLCLVPISCTQNVENDSGADYWAPAALGGGF